VSTEQAYIFGGDIFTLPGGGGRMPGGVGGGGGYGTLCSAEEPLPLFIAAAWKT
jgi:hypothetical protein